MSKFTLEVELGNAAMRTAADVARALRQAAERVEKYLGSPVNMVIKDDNGNKVGTWRIELPEEE
jgi:hypothetical protein